MSSPAALIARSPARLARSPASRCACGQAAQHSSNLYLGKVHSLIRNRGAANQALGEALQQFERMGQWQLAAYAA
ncbi:MAG: hypothetical protein M1546_24415, partial [Chloroflexi bacterium]|nr:hypothetical protein [Chloroflexota bacterium]